MALESVPWTWQVEMSLVSENGFRKMIQGKARRQEYRGLEGKMGGSLLTDQRRQSSKWFGNQGLFSNFKIKHGGNLSVLICQRKVPIVRSDI